MSTFNALELKDFDGVVSQSTFAKLTEELAKLAPNGGNEPFIVAETCPHVHGWDAGYMNFVPIGELLNASENKSVAQFEISVKNVVSVLMGTANKTAGLLHIRKIIKPVTVGVTENEDGSLSVVAVVGGRHRLTALLTAYHFSGVDLNSAEFRKMLLPVFLTPYIPEVVTADNVSRSMPPIELDNINLAEKGVDIEDRESIANAFENGILGNDARYMRIMSLYFRNFANLEDADNPELQHIHATARTLTPETLSKAMQSALTAYKDHAGLEGKAKAEFTKRLKNRGVLDALFVAFLKALPEAVKQCRDTGITNLARQAGLLGTAIEFIVRNKHKFVLPKPPEPPKVEVPADEAPAKPKRARRPKAKKEDEAVEIPQAPEVTNVPV